jgi:hypothetical protein
MAKRSCLRAGLRQRHCGLAGIPEKKISIPSTRSASLLHTGELRCVTGGKARWGESAAWFGCGMLVRFFWRAYLCEYLGGQRGRWNRILKGQ